MIIFLPFLLFIYIIHIQSCLYYHAYTNLHTSSLGRRNQINQRTSYLDLSVTYGNTLDGQNDLREPLTGMLIEILYIDL